MPTSLDARENRPVLVHTGDGAAETAERLRRIAGPGVPEVLEVEGDRIVTDWGPPLPLPAALADLAVLAGAVARAHEAGVLHGPFAAEHLRVGPLLLGWDPPGGWTVEDDVASFADALDTAGHPALAARARADIPAAIAALVPTPLLPRTPRDVRPRLPKRLVAAAPALALLALAATALRSARAPAAPIAPRPSTTTTISPTPTPTPTTALVYGGRRWRAGEDGDVIVLGDWDCDGTDTPAVLRPSTGEVWRYDRWEEGAATPVTTVPGAAELRAVPDGPCDRLVPG